MFRLGTYFFDFFTTADLAHFWPQNEFEAKENELYPGYVWSIFRSKFIILAKFWYQKLAYRSSYDVAVHIGHQVMLKLTDNVHKGSRKLWTRSTRTISLNCRTEPWFLGPAMGFYIGHIHIKPYVPSSTITLFRSNIKTHIFYLKIYLYCHGTFVLMWNNERIYPSFYRFNLIGWRSRYLHYAEDNKVTFDFMTPPPEIKVQMVPG